MGAVGITSGELARQVIDAIVDEGLMFSILHRSADLQRGQVQSDVDLVIAEPAPTFVQKLGPRLKQLGLSPILEWTYDVGGTASVFLASENAEDGIQLDLLHDPLGVGRYGFRTNALLGEVQTVDGWPALGHGAEMVYLLRKRLVKRNEERASEHREALSRQGRLEIEELLKRLLAPAAARSVLRYIARDRATGVRALLPSVGELRRILSRMIHPNGAWIHVEGPFQPEVSEIIARLGRFVPYTARGLARGPIWYFREVATVRWRAGIFITWGTLGRGLKPDIFLTPSGNVNDLARSVVSSLAHRIGEKWGLD